MFIFCILVLNQAKKISLTLITHDHVESLRLKINYLITGYFFQHLIVIYLLYIFLGENQDIMRLSSKYASKLVDTEQIITLHTYKYD